jgi:hypothetical protein
MSPHGTKLRYHDRVDLVRSTMKSGHAGGRVADHCYVGNFVCHRERSISCFFPTIASVLVALAGLSAGISHLSKSC